MMKQSWDAGWVTWKLLTRESLLTPMTTQQMASNYSGTRTGLLIFTSEDRSPCQTQARMSGLGFLSCDGETSEKQHFQRSCLLLSTTGESKKCSHWNQLNVTIPTPIPVAIWFSIFTKLFHSAHHNRPGTVHSSFFALWHNEISCFQNILHD